jgi:hypothetical protein
MNNRSKAPSILLGWRQAKVLWRIVVLVAILPYMLSLPMFIIASTTCRAVISDLPNSTTSLPPGEVELILIDALSQQISTISWLLLVGIAGFWLWNVLWHAGVVTWATWSTTVPVRAAAVLGLGVHRFWSFFRLFLTGLAVWTALVVGLWLLLLFGLFLFAGSESLQPELVTLGLGLLGMVLVSCVVWMATIRAAWLLGEVTARSAVLTWFRGLWNTFRYPIKSLKPFLVWALPGLVFGILPLVLGINVQILTGGLGGSLLGSFCALLQAFCWVALFVSYAPPSVSAAVFGETQKKAAK